MTEKVRIYDPVECAIIGTFSANPKRKLVASQIKAFVKKYIKISDQNIQKRIERMAKKELLLSESIRTTKSLYSLNPEIEFQYEGKALEFIEDFEEKAIQETQTTPERIAHTNDLKNAIRTWIRNLAEPSREFPVGASARYSAIIGACESDVLFPDLANHLPGVSSDIYGMWSNYKTELINLHQLK
jgi:hypothetical protein